MNFVNKYVWKMLQYLLYLIILVLIIFVFNMKQKEEPNLKILMPENPLDGCLHVYLDVGANRGVQVRKLYESHLFPKAPILKIFRKYFGALDNRNRKQICAVGFEPNPMHESWLTQLSAAYRKCGWRVAFKTKTGVDKKNSNNVRYAWFSTVMKNDVGQAGRIVEDTRHLGNKTVVSGRKLKQISNITTIRLAEYILDVVGKRKLPKNNIAPKVIMKIDIEGKELEVMLDIIVKGALGVLDEIHIEWTKSGPFVDGKKINRLKNAVNVIKQLAHKYGLQHQCSIEALDDETYYSYKGSLPKC